MDLLQNVAFREEEVKNALDAYFKGSGPRLVSFTEQPSFPVNEKYIGFSKCVPYNQHNFIADIVLDVSPEVKRRDLREHLCNTSLLVGSSFMHDFGSPLRKTGVGLDCFDWSFAHIENYRVNSVKAIVKYPVHQAVSLKISDPELKHLEYQDEVEFREEKIDVLKERATLHTYIYPTQAIYDSIRDGTLEGRERVIFSRDDLKQIDKRFR
jgi:hypothetical protein